MIDIVVWKKAWQLLDAAERRRACVVLGVIVVSGFASAMMVASVLPFLSVLSDPDRIHEQPWLSWLYEIGGFTDDHGFLVALGALSIGAILLSNAVMLLRVYAVSRFAVMRIHSLSKRLLRGYLSQSYEAFLTGHSGVRASQILAETQQVVKQFFLPAAETVASAFTVISIVAMLFMVDPAATGAAFALFGGVYGVALLVSRRMVARLGRIRAQSNKARFVAAGEALGGIKDIKVAGRERAFLMRYSGPSERMARTAVLINVIGESPQYVMQIVAFGGMIGLCLVLLDPAGLAQGTALVDILPLLGLFAFAAQRLMPELSRFYRSVIKLQYSRAAVEAIHGDLTGALPEGGRLVDDGRQLRLTQALVFDDVGYSYPGAEAPGLRNVSLTIRASEKIGIVGGTGAGKTTLADILLGLLEPQQGRLIADGVTIAGDTLRAWRRSVGYVPQHIFLIDGTVAENIAFGVQTAQIDRVRLEHAARIAHIHDHVAALPQGYDSPVGERGVRLSGGQRQRIGIARALYHDADLIVFDEATSALDTLTERDIIGAIEALPGSKTVVMIAHRLSTVRGCDRILLMRGGRVAEIGTWDELSRESAAFRALTAATAEAS